MATSRRALILQLEYYAELRKGETVPNDLAIERDRRRIDDPMQWPGIRLPLKRPNAVGWPDFGWLFTGMAWESDQRIVFLGNVFDAAATGTEVYESTQALLDAGWMVD